MEQVKGFFLQPVAMVGTMQVQVWHVLIALVGMYLLTKKR